MKDLKKKTINGIAWTFIDRAGSQFIGFVITIFLARLLSPSEFGLVAMASVVIAITRIFVDSGLRDSLIQKQDCTELDYSTVFFFNIGVSTLLFIVIYFCAPFIANFYAYIELTNVIRALGFIPFIVSFAIVQTALIHKDLKFKVLAKIRIPASLISGIIGLGLAWKGFGVWALVVQNILEPLLFNIFLWIISPWRPSFIFDRETFYFHWKHGSRLMLISALGAIYRNIFSLIIGKFFSPAQLGFYSRADSFKSIVYNNTVSLVQTVSYPVLAHHQDDDELLKRNYRKIQQATMFILLPIAAVLITGAEPIIEFLLTKKWLPAAPILQVLMLAVVLSPFNSINLNILKVKRRTDLLLRTDIVNKVFLVCIVLVTVRLGFDYLVLTNLLMAVLTLFVNNYYTNKLIRFSFKEQLFDLSPFLGAFIVAIVTVQLIGYYFIDLIPFVEMLVKSVLVVGFYLLLVYVLKRDALFDIRKSIMMIFNKN